MWRSRIVHELNVAESNVSELKRSKVELYGVESKS
jgi:hypothetical protein